MEVAGGARSSMVIMRSVMDWWGRGNQDENGSEEEYT